MRATTGYKESNTLSHSQCIIAAVLNCIEILDKLLFKINDLEVVLVLLKSKIECYHLIDIERYDHVATCSFAKFTLVLSVFSKSGC